jgi:hypothetical protein
VIGDLDCGRVGHRRFEVIPPDPHQFDLDYDGIRYESDKSLVRKCVMLLRSRRQYVEAHASDERRGYHLVKSRRCLTQSLMTSGYVE